MVHPAECLKTACLLCTLCKTESNVTKGESRLHRLQVWKRNLSEATPCDIKSVTLCPLAPPKLSRSIKHPSLTFSDFYLKIIKNHSSTLQTQNLSKVIIDAMLTGSTNTPYPFCGIMATAPCLVFDAFPLCTCMTLRFANSIASQPSSPSGGPHDVVIVSKRLGAWRIDEW